MDIYTEMCLEKQDFQSSEAEEMDCKQQEPSEPKHSSAPLNHLPFPLLLEALQEMW